MPENKIEFKIIKDSSGQKVDLSNMSLEATTSLVTLLTSLTNIIKLNPDADKVTIQIVEGSARLIAEAPEPLIEQFEKGFADVLQHTSGDKELVDNWEAIQSLFKKNGLEYEANFYRNSVKTSVHKLIKSSKRFRIKTTRRKSNSDFELVFITGKLIEVGGKKPNIHIIGLDEIAITVNCEESEARKVNAFLYNQVKVSARRKKKPDGDYQYSFCDNYVNDDIYNDFQNFIVHANSQDEMECLIQVHNKIRDYIDAENFGVLRKFLRLYNHMSYDVSTLKTILVVTKSLKQHQEISELRGSIKALLEQKIGPIV